MWDRLFILKLVMVLLQDLYCHILEVFQEHEVNDYVETKR